MGIITTIIILCIMCTKRGCALYMGKYGESYCENSLCFRTVLNEGGGEFCSPRVMWQCLETFFVVVAGGRGATGIH